MEEGGANVSIVSNFMKPIEHRHGWPVIGNEHKDEEVKDEQMIVETKDDDIKEKNAAIDLTNSDEHVPVERRPSNEVKLNYL